MKVVVDDAGRLTRITKLMDPAEAYGEYIGATLIEPRRGRAWPTRWRRPGGATRTCTTRTATRSCVDRGGEVAVAPIGDGRLGRGRQPRRPGPGAGDRVPLLARTVLTPLAIDVRRGAVADLGAILADQRISAGGDVAVVVGPGQGERIAELIRPALRLGRHLHRRRRHPRRRACELAGKLRARSYDAVVGIGGGKTIDTAKYAATRLRHCRWSRWRPTWPRRHRLAGQPASTTTAARGSYGVHIPIAVVVDLDFVGDAARRGIAGPASATWSATSARSPTGSWPARSAASRSTGWP